MASFGYLSGITSFYQDAPSDDDSYNPGTMLTRPSASMGRALPKSTLPPQLTTIGLITAGLGAVNSAIGSFYAAKSAQYQEKSQASSLAFQSDMASINAGRAEMSAESIEEAGKSQIANYTMQAGEQKASATASMAARGISLGVGSAAVVSASMDIQKDINVMNINANVTRQAWAAREQATDYSNQALLTRTGSVNALRSADSISPVSSTVNSLMGSATKVAQQWDYNKWLRNRGIV